MCMVSAVGDNFKDSFPNKWPQFNQPFPAPEVSRADLDALRKEMAELKKLLSAAKKFDDSTGQPHCEMDEKVDLIKKLAALVGVDLEDVFGKEPKTP